MHATSVNFKTKNSLDFIPETEKKKITAEETFDNYSKWNPATVCSTRNELSLS